MHLYLTLLCPGVFFSVVGIDDVFYVSSRKMWAELMPLSFFYLPGYFGEVIGFSVVYHWL